MLDPSEIDRIAEVTRVSLMRLVDWKNRAGDPFRLVATPKPEGGYRCEIDLPQPVVVENCMPLVHGEYDKRDEEGGRLVYESRPGNALGQAKAADGRPSFGVAYDATTVDDEGRPLLKVYFGTASEWYVKNQYHDRWQALRDVKEELHPTPKPAAREARPEAKPPEPRKQGGGRGRGRGGRPRGSDRGGGGESGGATKGRSRRGRRGGRGRGRASRSREGGGD